jgi:2-polyprenyl-3-methyl-5-hydroxy-6-metoxy-1,4-benzoquinol methylase
MTPDPLYKRREYDADRPYYEILLSWHRTGLWRARIEGILREIEPYLVAHARVLDLGCAIGTFAVELAARPGLHVVGVDFSTTALAMAAEHAGASRPDRRAAFVASAAEQLGLRDGAFDVVVAADVIEHLVDPETLVREAHRVLRPGGVLVLETPNTLFRTWPAYPRLLAWSDRLGLARSRIVCDLPEGADYNHYHLALRSYPELLAMCRRAGFEIVRHRPFGWWLELHGLDRATRAVCRMLRPLWPRAAHYADTDVLIVARRIS